MDETIIFPSPNWFQQSGLAVSSDGWVIYGGPNKSLCVLEPLPADYDAIVQGNQAYTAHLVNRAHPEKITCVDICREWPQKRAVLTGSSDGAVHQWSLEHSDNTLKITSTHNHEIHSHDKEEVVGVGYCDNGYAVTVGAYGNIAKWDMNSNVAKCFNHVMKNFKPVCMAVSPHLHMFVAIGTKQGIVFVLDLNGAARVVYKMRGHDDEIHKVSWCPQYEVAVRKSLKESDKKSSASQRMEKIRVVDEPEEVLKELEERVKNSETAEKPVLINETMEPVEDTASVACDTVKQELEQSGVVKNLPEDSFDVVPDDDMFDIYADHEADEFGHKKYQPENILVKIVEETPKEDFLSECQKLKSDILKRKEETTIEALVDALDKTNVNGAGASPSKVKDVEVSSDIKIENVDVEKVEVETAPPIIEKPSPPVEGKIIKGEVESSVHIHKHLLVSIGKQGGVRVWSKSGKLVGTCAVAGVGRPNQRGQRTSTLGCTTLHWHQPDVLLIADGKSQLLECNPLKIDCKNKLEWHVVHTHHKRGMFVITSEAPRVQTPGMPHADWKVWTAAQDRLLLTYSLKENTFVERATVGGYIYYVSYCPYDPRKIAMSVGDGAIRVWESDTCGDGDKVLKHGNISTYWNNVQGKVLTHAWHPTRENLLAFATGEARVGLLDIGGKGEKRARVLLPALRGAIYSLYWGEGSYLYAAGCGEIVLYDIDKVDEEAVPIPVVFENIKWKMSTARWYPQGLVVGSESGGVAIMTPTMPHQVVAAHFLQEGKTIHTVEWHESEGGQLKDGIDFSQLLAACSLQKDNAVTILRYADDESGTKQLSKWKVLIGHKGAVLKVQWSPHREEQLLSTSADCTVRIWDVITGSCVSIFGGHYHKTLSCCVPPPPSLQRAVISAAADFTLRLWNAELHTPDKYNEITEKRKKKRKDKKNKQKQQQQQQGAADNDNDNDSDNAATVLDTNAKCSKRFLLPATYKQCYPCPPEAPWAMYRDAMSTQTGEVLGPLHTNVRDTPHREISFIRLFGDINQLNDLLNDEAERHEDTGSWESWVVLSIVRGDIDTAMRRALTTDKLDTYLLSIAPSVSFKYWKDVTVLYLQQIERLAAKGQEAKLNASYTYGGCVWRRVCGALALHDVRAASALLTEHKLHLEAYVLARTRYQKELATQSLVAWAEDALQTGHYNLAGCIYISLCEFPLAAAALARSSEQSALQLAHHIATYTGQDTFAIHIHNKQIQLQHEKNEHNLTPLPTRVELVQKINDEDTTSTTNSSEVDLKADCEVNEGVDLKDEKIEGIDLKDEKMDDGNIDNKEQSDDVSVTDDKSNDVNMQVDIKGEKHVVVEEKECLIEKSDETIVTDKNNGDSVNLQADAKGEKDIVDAKKECLIEQREEVVITDKSNGDLNGQTVNTEDKTLSGDENIESSIEQNNEVIDNEKSNGDQKDKVTNDEEIKVGSNVKASSLEDKNEASATEIDIEKLPEKMQGLMREGDGDTIRYDVEKNGKNKELDTPIVETGAIQ